MDESAIAELLRQHRCNYIQAAVQSAAVASAMRRFAISVSDQEARAAQQAYTAVESSQDKSRQPDLNKPLSEGLNAVYEKQQDAAEVYRSIIQPAGIAEAVWHMSLEYGKDPAYRARLGRMAANAGTTDVASNPAATEAFRKALERKKLDIAIDGDIAAGDERFRTMLAEVRRNTQRLSPFRSRSRMTVAQKVYLDERRGAWWTARYSEVSLVLYDASLAKSCGL